MSVGGLGGAKAQNEVVKLVARETGASVNAVKTAIQEQFGNPIEDAAGSVFNFNMPSEGTNNIDFSNLLDNSMFEQNQSEQNGAGNILQEIMNFFKGNNNSQKNSDTKDQDFGVGTGPQKPDNTQPHLGVIQQGEQSNQPEEIKKEINFFIEE